MKKNSRIIAALLVAVMGLSLCACGKNKDKAPTPVETEAATTEPPLPTPIVPDKPLYACVMDDGTKIVVDGEGNEMDDYHIGESGNIADVNDCIIVEKDKVIEFIRMERVDVGDNKPLQFEAAYEITVPAKAPTIEADGTLPETEVKPTEFAIEIDVLPRNASYPVIKVESANPDVISWDISSNKIAADKENNESVIYVKAVNGKATLNIKALTEGESALTFTTVDGKNSRTIAVSVVKENLSDADCEIPLPSGIKGYIIKDETYLRAEANDSGNILGTYNNSKEVILMDKDKNGWTMIYVDGMKGYVKSDCIDTSKPSAVSPSQSPSTEPTTPPGEIVNPDATPLPRPVHKHNYVIQIVEPTCKTQGYTLHICDCGESYKDQYVAVGEHIFSNEVIKPTDTEQGYTLHTCIICGYEYRDEYMDKLSDGK